LATCEGAEPDPCPPKELANEEPLALLARAFARLLDEFAARKPEDPAGFWYTPDQTVGFWNETCSNDTRQFGVGRRLENFSLRHERLAATNERCLAQQG
jgi:hypothetical protein